MVTIQWNQIGAFTPKKYTCGYCEALVGPNTGFTGKYAGNGQPSYVYICSNCDQPTFFGGQDRQYPGAPFGNDVGHLPDPTKGLYKEARACMTVSAYTASVLCCRKILMNIAVEKGAKAGEKFIVYIEHLAEKGYVPPDGREWVDYIRKKGNEANHEIANMGREDAQHLLVFVEMLLKFVYEFGKRLPKEPAK